MKFVYRKENMFQTAVYLVILAMPIYGIRISFFDTSVSLLDIFMLMVVGMSIKYLGIHKKKNFSLYVRSRSKSVVFGVILLFVGLLGSLLANPPYMEKLGIMIEWFMLPILTAIIISIAVFQRKICLESVIYTYFVSAGIVALLALMYLISGNVTYDGRLSAFYMSPNHLAMYISPALIAGWFLFSRKESVWNINKKIAPATKVWCFRFTVNKKWQKLLYNLLFVLILVALYNTHSYGAWVAVIVSVSIGEFLFRVSNVKHQKKNNIFKISKKIKMVLIGIFVIGILAIFQWNNDKFQDMVSLDERSSLMSRVMIWESAIHIAKDHWFWGIGPGAFQSVYLEYQRFYPPYLEWAVPQPHNIYLAFWLQSGIVGLLGFLLLASGKIGMSLKKIVHSQSIYQENHSKIDQYPVKQIRIILLMMILSILLHGLIDTPIWKNDLSLLFWLVFFLKYSEDSI